MGFGGRKRISTRGLSGLTICFLLALSFSGVSPAGAAGTDDLYACGELNRAIERDDGSIVALGATSACTSADGAPKPWSALIGLDANGHLLPGFGNGGVARVPGNATPTLISRPGGGVIVPTDSGVLGFDADGQLDGSFGSGGSIERSGFRTAVAGRDGSLYLRWGGSAGLFSKFSLDGELDSGFGDGGVLHLPAGVGAGPAVDSRGRIVYTLSGYQKVARLLPDGMPDTSFGPGGDGLADLDIDIPFYIFRGIGRIEIGARDSILVIGSGSAALYVNPPFITGVDSDGNSLPGFPITVAADSSSSVTQYGDEFAFGQVPDRFDPDDIHMTIRSTGWEAHLATILNAGFTNFLSSPVAGGSDQAATPYTPLADGGLLAVGTTSGRFCPLGKCGYVGRMALVRADSNGHLVGSFGDEGSVVIPSPTPTCRWGSAGEDGDWKACRLRPPRITGSARLTGRLNSGPGMLIRLSLGPQPANNPRGGQRVALAMPGRLRVREGKLQSRVHLSISPRHFGESWVQGRKLKVLIPRNGKPATELKVKIRIKPGAIKPLRDPGRVRGMKIRVHGIFMPFTGSNFAPGSANAAVALSRRAPGSG